MSQFREGSLGRLSSHEVGIPVYWSAALIPDFGFTELELGTSRALNSLIPGGVGVAEDQPEMFVLRFFGHFFGSTTWVSSRPARPPKMTALFYCDNNLYSMPCPTKIV